MTFDTKCGYGQIPLFESTQCIRSLQVTVGCVPSSGTFVCFYDSTVYMRVHFLTGIRTYYYVDTYTYDVLGIRSLLMSDLLSVLLMFFGKVVKHATDLLSVFLVFFEKVVNKASVVYIT
jgi:hypothetical protein